MITYNTDFNYAIKEDFTLALSKAIVGKLNPTELLKMQPFLYGQNSFGAKQLPHLAYLMACNKDLKTGYVGTYVANQNRYILDIGPFIGRNYYYIVIDLGVTAAKHFAPKPSEKFIYYPADYNEFNLIGDDLYVLAGIIETSEVHTNALQWLTNLCESQFTPYSSFKVNNFYFEPANKTCFKVYTF